MAVVAVFDEDALVVQPHELTPDDRKAISEAITEYRKQHDTVKMANEALRRIEPSAEANTPPK